MTEPLPPLVSPAWLAERLTAPGLRVVDGSWHLPTSGRDAAAEFVAGHIPGAVFFNLDASSDSASPLPHMLPSAEAFAERMSALGVSRDDTIIVYDTSGKNLSAPRVWWMLRVFGHERVAVLDGGFGTWQREGRPITREIVTLPRGRFTAQLDTARVRDLNSIVAGLPVRADQIVDMRGAGRFAGTEPEPRQGLRSGHIPGSLNVPYDSLVHADGAALSEIDLRAHLAAAGVDLTRPVLATCGSGVSACALLLNLYRLGHEDATLYDGSWTEWGGRADVPVEAGAPVGLSRSSS